MKKLQEAINKTLGQLDPNPVDPYIIMMCPRYFGGGVHITFPVPVTIYFSLDVKAYDVLLLDKAPL